MSESFLEHFDKIESLTDQRSPAYVQVAAHLARQISAGQLAVGTKLPPERRLAQQYHIAVGTLRKSLSHLTQLGLIEKKHGSGNYIARTNYEKSVYHFFRLELAEGGGLPSASLIDAVRVKKPDALPQLGPTASEVDYAYRFRRVRYLDQQPVALEEIWLDGSAATSLDYDAISDSLYHYYHSQLGIMITRVEDQISVAPPPLWYKGQDYEQMGYIERFGWSQTNDRIEYSRSWFAPDRARYVARLK